MTDAPATTPPDELVTHVCRLTPETTHVFEGSFSLLHCAVKGHGLYRGVFCVLLFPVTHPDHFVSLRHTDDKDKVQEIGVIEDLSMFSDEQRALVRANLARHYHEQVITRVYSVRCEFGILFLDVGTQRGREQFMLPWRIDRAEDYGLHGKVLLDALDNRYIIPNVATLPPADHRRFTSYIYW
ncbi:MAG: DUF1854 domain-containing protein [Verrucomicrobia bacterium]|nr:DUF1854 domain-containing protein [Verrucomicrobiota bacterium]